MNGGNLEWHTGTINYEMLPEYLELTSSVDDLCLVSDAPFTFESSSLSVVSSSGGFAIATTNPVLDGADTGYGGNSTITVMLGAITCVIDRSTSLQPADVNAAVSAGGIRVFGSGATITLETMRNECGMSNLIRCGASTLHVGLLTFGTGFVNASF
jgi:hypothetical protein